MNKTNRDFEKNADRHMRLLNEIHDMYRSKNSDYGGSFTNLYRKFGLVSPIIKLEDKLSRLESLLHKDAKVKSESIEDTLLDMANYAIMTVLELRKDKNYYDDVDLFSFDYDSLPKVVAVDFDGTLVRGAKFPEIGEFNSKLAMELFFGKYKDYKKVLWTHRSGETLQAALDYLEAYHPDVKFDAVNDNIPEVKELLHGGPPKKIWFDVFIDDKAWNTNEFDHHARVVSSADVINSPNFDESKVNVFDGAGGGIVTR